MPRKVPRPGPGSGDPQVQPALIEADGRSPTAGRVGKAPGVVDGCGRRDLVVEGHRLDDPGRQPPQPEQVGPEPAVGEAQLRLVAPDELRRLRRQQEKPRRPSAARR